MDHKTSRLLGTALISGALCCLLRLVLYRTGFDEKNILSASHPLHLICLGLTALTVLSLLRQVLPLKGSVDPAVVFPASPLRSLGIFCAGCLLSLHGITLTENLYATLDYLRLALALISALSMLICALPLNRFRQVQTFCRGIIALFFCIEMLSRYRGWSGNPQLPDYMFQVLACVALTLCSYHRLAFDTGLGNRWILLLCGLTALQLSLLCAAGPETPIFYLAGTLWAGGCLCSAQPEEEAQHDVSA